MHIRAVLVAAVCGLWRFAEADFGEKIIADVKPSDKPEFDLQFTKFNSFSPSLKTKQYSTRYKSRDTNVLDPSSQQTFRGGPVSAIVAPPLDFNFKMNKDVEAPLGENTEGEIEAQALTLERSDTNVHEQPAKAGKRRIHSKVFRKRLRERLRQRLQNDTTNNSNNSQDASKTSTQASRARNTGTSNTSSREYSTPRPSSEKDETTSSPNQRARSGTGRRGNNTFYAKYKGRTAGALSNSRGLRLRSRLSTTTTTEKITTLPQINYTPSPRDQLKSQLNSGEAKTDDSMKPSPIDTLKMKRTRQVDEFVPVSGSTNFEDIFSDFRSKQRNIKVTKRPNSLPQRQQVAAPEVRPTTVALHTKTNNQNVKTFTVTKQPSTLQSSVDVIAFSPEKNIVSQNSQIQSTVYQFGPSFSAKEHDKSQNHQLNEKDNSFIIKLEPQELHLNDEHFSEPKKHCESDVSDPQCKFRSGVVNTSILESTRDIIKQAETAEVFRERSRPLQTSKATRPASWHDAPAPNAVQPPPSSRATPVPPQKKQATATDGGNLYRDDVTSGNNVASWHQRRPKQEIKPRTEASDDSSAKTIQSVDFNAARTPRPAVFSTFDHFLRIHGVTESPFTVVKAPRNHSSMPAVSYQNSYLGSFNEFSKTTSKTPLDVPSFNNHPNSLGSTKGEIALADLTLNSFRGSNQIKDQNVFFRTPSPLTEATTFILTTTAAPPRFQRARNTRVVDHSLPGTTQNYNTATSYSHFYTHGAEHSTPVPHSLRFSRGKNFNEQPILPKKQISPSKVNDFSPAKLSSKLRNHEVSRETLHHQVLQSPEEPAFITYQKRTQLANFPNPSVVRQSHTNNLNHDLPTSTHFKAVLLDDGKGEPKVHSPAPQYRLNTRVPNIENVHNTRPEEITNNVLFTRPANIGPGRNRLFRNPGPGLGRLPRGPNPQENFFKVLRPRNPVNYRLNAFMRPPSQRRTQQRTNSRSRLSSKSRNRPRRIQDSLSAQESRDNFIITPPRVPFIRTSHFNAGGHKMNGLYQQKRKITSRPSFLSPPLSKIEMPSYQQIKISQRPQIVLNSRPPITSLPAHLQLSPNFPEPSRDARQSPLNRNTHFVSSFHKVNPPEQITRHHHQPKATSHLPQQNIAQFPPTVKPLPKESKAQVRESFPETEHFQSARLQSQSQHQPTPSASHVYRVKEREPLHHNEISISGISQPLPHHALLKTSRKKMAESHVSLLKNLQFGVNGEPLDVWIPMKSDRTLKLVGRGQTPSLERAHVRPRNSLPIPVGHEFDSSMTERVDPMHTSESKAVSELAIKDVLDGDQDFDYNDYDEYKDRQDEPHAASSVEEVATQPDQAETEDYPDYQDSPFGQRENSVDENPTQEDEQEEDEEDVFEEDDDEDV